MTVKTAVIVGIYCGIVALLAVTFFEALAEMREPAAPHYETAEAELPHHLLREVLDITRADLS
jgi:hypothetical protein